MSEYTKVLTELVELPGRLDSELAHSEQEVAAERKAREREIGAYTEEHEAVLAKLEAILRRARAEGFELDAGAAGAGDDQVAVSADPVEHARQLVTRLEEALDHLLYTRKALAAEQASLSEEEKQRAAEDRRKRERAALQLGERWERARQGTAALLIALGVAAVAGMAAGAVGSAAAVIGVAAVAALACLLAVHTVASTLPALAARRATGSLPAAPEAPPREARLGRAGYAAAGLGLPGLGALLAGLVAGAASSALAAAALLTVVGATVTVVVWLLLPRAK